jgi:hypothetical protein
LNREYLSDRNKIAQEFNHFVERNEALPDDIAWAYRRNPDLHPPFVLQIPKFVPRDLFYLVIQQSDAGPRVGFLFKTIEALGIKPAFLTEISEASGTTRDSFADVVNQLSQLALKHYAQGCTPSCRS